MVSGSNHVHDKNYKKSKRRRKLQSNRIDLSIFIINRLGLVYLIKCINFNFLFIIKTKY